LLKKPYLASSVELILHPDLLFNFYYYSWISILPVGALDIAGINI
jgi:hypothetical protein